MMSLFAICCVAACVAGLLTLLWLLARPLPQEMLLRRGEPLEDLLLRHALHLPQLRRSLAGADTRFLQLKTSAHAQKYFRSERCQIVERFLFALADDFGRLEQMAALAGEMLPRESSPQRTVPLSLQLQFRANYRLACFQLTISRLQPTSRIIRLTELLANLSLYTEDSMNRLTRLPAPGPWQPLSKIRPR